MGPNPFIGVIYHWIGGLAAGSFYIPYRAVKKWSWETYWLAGGFFSWIIAPWLLAWLLVPDFMDVLRQAPGSSLFWAYFWGLVWGIGGLTFGLTMRYLGIALGVAVALGYCAVFGTLIPPIYNGDFGAILREASGQLTLLGVALCVAGIAVSGMAGRSKERELTTEQKQATVEEFNFIKGILVATVSGVLSAAMSFAFTAGKPISALAKASLLAHNRADLWQNLPLLIVVLFGGFTTNFVWCVMLNFKNKTWGQYLSATVRGDFPSREQETIIETATDAPGEEMAAHIPSGQRAVATSRVPGSVPLVANYIFCALAGVTWYLQFFFYGMGTTKMGKYDFSSWTLHMASIIIFSTLWGIMLREWKGASKKTHLLIGVGLAVLIASTIVVGIGNWMKATTGH
jgi:L-rhamnose-H+ transport protein